MANEVRTGVANALADQGIDYVHWECHKGKIFRFGLRNQHFAANATMNMVFTTGAKEAHFHPSVEVNGPSLQNLYEDANVSAAGTSFTIVNFNRNFDTSPGLTASYLATASDGTEIWQSMVVGGTAGSGQARDVVAFGGAADPGVEFILKPNTVYRAQLVNAALTELMINFQCYFYEE